MALGLFLANTLGSPAGVIRPGWVPDTAVAAYNAMTGQTYRATTSFARSSTALWNPVDDYEEYATNVLRREDGVGMILEVGSENLFTRSNTFTDASWSKVRSSVNLEAAETGPISGDVYKFLDDMTASATHALTKSITTASGDAAFSVLAKYDGRDIRLHVPGAMTSGGSDVHATFDLQSGSAVSTGGTPVITALGDNWYWCVLILATVAGSGAPIIYLSNGGSIVYSGDGASGALLQNAQFEQLAKATTPIITGAATATRAVDELTITPTPAYSLDWHARYDDDSEDIYATGVTGAHLIDPATLTRPGVEIIWATEAA